MAVITEAMVAEVRRLLELGQLTQRQVAAQVGISQSTLTAINKGRWRQPFPRSSEPLVDRRPGVCPICGRDGLLPCIKCSADRYAKVDGRQAPEGAGPYHFDPTPAEIAERAAVIREAGIEHRKRQDPLPEIDGHPREAKLSDLLGDEVPE